MTSHVLKNHCITYHLQNKVWKNILHQHSTETQGMLYFSRFLSKMFWNSPIVWMAILPEDKGGTNGETQCLPIKSKNMLATGYMPGTSAGKEDRAYILLSQGSPSSRVNCPQNSSSSNFPTNLRSSHTISLALPQIHSCILLAACQGSRCSLYPGFLPVKTPFNSNSIKKATSTHPMPCAWLNAEITSFLGFHLSSAWPGLSA